MQTLAGFTADEQNKAAQILYEMGADSVGMLPTSEDRVSALVRSLARAGVVHMGVYSDEDSQYDADDEDSGEDGQAYEPSAAPPAPAAVPMDTDSAVDEMNLDDIMADMAEIPLKKKRKRQGDADSDADAAERLSAADALLEMSRASKKRRTRGGGKKKCKKQKKKPREKM